MMSYKFDVENNALTRLKGVIKNNRIETKMLIYYPQNKLPDNVISSPNKILFSDKETTWIGRPKLTEVQDFLNEEFDLLIDMSSDECFPLHYAAVFSKAAFKVGRMSYPDSPYDFLLMGEEHADDEKFIKDLELYLAKFK